MVKLFIALLVLTVTITAFTFKQAAPETWRKDQLLEPADLVNLINNPGKQPVIFSIGFGAGIKNSIVMGPVSDSANLLKWKAQLQNMPKNANIVVYCGCCPFVHCPNVRPAVKLLNDLQFTNAKLLNLSHNLKTDWIDKGYPVESKQ